MFRPVYYAHMAHFLSQCPQVSQPTAMKLGSVWALKAAEEQVTHTFWRSTQRTPATINAPPSGRQRGVHGADLCHVVVCHWYVHDTPECMRALQTCTAGHCEAAIGVQMNCTDTCECFCNLHNSAFLESVVTDLMVNWSMFLPVFGLHHPHP